MHKRGFPSKDLTKKKISVPQLLSTKPTRQTSTPTFWPRGRVKSDFTRGKNNNPLRPTSAGPGPLLGPETGKLSPLPEFFWNQSRPGGNPPPKRGAGQVGQSFGGASTPNGGRGNHNRRVSLRGPLDRDPLGNPGTKGILPWVRFETRFVPARPQPPELLRPGCRLWRLSGPSLRGRLQPAPDLGKPPAWTGPIANPAVGSNLTAPALTGTGYGFQLAAAGKQKKKPGFPRISQETWVTVATAKPTPSGSYLFNGGTWEARWRSHGGDTRPL